jgi:hypothetical protein
MPGGTMKPPKSLAVPTFRAPVNVTKRGRRFLVCPGCQVISAAIPIGVSRYTCRHCGTEFELVAKREVAP